MQLQKAETWALSPVSSLWLGCLWRLRKAESMTGNDNSAISD